MGWEQLTDILQQNRREAEMHLADPPVACPFDGEPLDIRADGVRNCPLGNYTWRGEPKLI